MALVTLAYRRSDTALPAGSGFLVPPVDGRTIKASTFASQKWGWIADENPDVVVLRTSVGRHGETKILERDDADLGGRLPHRSARNSTSLRTGGASTFLRWPSSGLFERFLAHGAEAELNSFIAVDVVRADRRDRAGPGLEHGHALDTTVVEETLGHSQLLGEDGGHQLKASRISMSTPAGR